MKNQKHNRQMGLLMIVSATVFWGMSGLMIEWLFEETHISPNTFLMIRLLIAGIVILAVLAGMGQNIWKIWIYPKQGLSLLIFGLVGMLGAQYAFISTINAANAVTATLFQFLGPVFITMYVSFRQKKLPALKQVIAIILALMGVYFLITNGSIYGVLLSTSGVIWGLLTAVGFAYYTLSPIHMIQKWGTSLIVGWGMLIGGIGLGTFNAVWLQSDLWPSVEEGPLFMMGLIIFSGTLSFLLYIASLNHIKPTEASILSSIEPLVAFIGAIVWLKQSFGPYQLTGGLFIVIAVIFLTAKNEEPKDRMDVKPRKQSA